MDDISENDRTNPKKQQQRIQSIHHSKKNKNWKLK